MAKVTYAKKANMGFARAAATHANLKRGGVFMQQIKKILYPMDLTAKNEKIIPYVQSMAQAHQAQVHILNVVEDIKTWAGFYVPHLNLDDLSDQMITGAQKKLKEYVSEHMGDPANLTLNVVVGDPAICIVDYVTQNGIDLVVMGTHGRSGLEHAIMGSVAEKVLRKTPAPVFIINTAH
jgi:nucleotide-binding universal stress UspA family protein